MPNTWREATNQDQKVPKPEGYEGSNEDAWVMTVQDGRLGYEAGTGTLDTLDELREIRNPRPIKKH